MHLIKISYFSARQRASERVCERKNDKEKKPCTFYSPFAPFNILIHHHRSPKKKSEIKNCEERAKERNQWQA
jgi:hypothetical protein